MKRDKRIVLILAEMGYLQIESIIIKWDSGSEYIFNFNDFTFNDIMNKMSRGGWFKLDDHVWKWGLIGIDDKTNGTPVPLSVAERLSTYYIKQCIDETY